MNSVTDSGGKWRLAGKELENIKTGEVRILENIPSSAEIARISEKTFVTRCSVAFCTGKWPD